MSVNTYTVILYRSGRCFVLSGEHTLTHDPDPPLLMEVVHTERMTRTAILGLVLLKYVDRANQPNQHVCAPCPEPCCVCMCGLPLEQHTPTMSPAHNFVPMADRSHTCPPCELPHLTHCTNPLVCATEGDACDWHQYQRKVREGTLTAPQHGLQPEPQVKWVQTPCPEPCCNMYCVCGSAVDAHHEGMSQPHPFTPASTVARGPRRDPKCKTRSCTSFYPCADCQAKYP